MTTKICDQATKNWLDFSVSHLPRCICHSSEIRYLSSKVNTCTANFVTNTYSVTGTRVSELAAKTETYMYLKVALHEKKLMMRLFPGDDSFRTPLLKCCNSNNYKYSFANIYY